LEDLWFFQEKIARTRERIFLASKGLISNEIPEDDYINEKMMMMKITNEMNVDAGILGLDFSREDTLMWATVYFQVQSDINKG